MLERAAKRAYGATNAGLGAPTALKPGPMQFLKTLLWVVVAALLTILGSRNWHDVTLNLWGDIQADIKVPVLILFVFLLGFLPMYFVHRGRIWSYKRRVEAFERQQAPVRPVASPVVEEPAE